MKKLISLALVLAMCLSMFPGSAFSEETAEASAIIETAMDPDEAAGDNTAAADSAAEQIVESVTAETETTSANETTWAASAAPAAETVGAAQEDSDTVIDGSSAVFKLEDAYAYNRSNGYREYPIN